MSVMSGETTIRLMVISWILTPFAIMALLAGCSALSRTVEKALHAPPASPLAVTGPGAAHKI
jgi:hypothetical protein